MLTITHTLARSIRSCTTVWYSGRTAMHSHTMAFAPCRAALSMQTTCSFMFAPSGLRTMGSSRSSP